MPSDGSTALIGEPGGKPGTDAAWVFTRSGSTWSQGSKLTASDEIGSPLPTGAPAGSGQFGYGVAAVW